MALIVTNEDFAKAVAWLIDNGGLPVQGERFIDRAERKVWDERGLNGGNVEITPDSLILEAALDSALLKEIEENGLSAAQFIALYTARDYLKRQLSKANPDLQAITTTVKGYVDGHPVLLQMVNNQISVLRAAHGWPVLNLANAADRSRYMLAIEAIIAILS